MIKLQKTCRVCKAIKRDKRLMNKIYNTSAYDRTSDISLLAFHQEYKDKFSYLSLLNHTKKHQALNADDLNERHLRNIARTAEKKILKDTIESKNIWQKVLDKGDTGLEDGTIKIRAGDILRAAKDKSDYDLKVKDQELAMIEMVYHFTSGEDSPINVTAERIIDVDTSKDTTDTTTKSTETGSQGPSGVYYPPTWDATA